VWFFAMIGTLPELVTVWPERTAVRQTFSNYADALVNQKFEEAYGYQSREFQGAISFDDFVRYQRETQAKFGALKSVEQRGMTVRKWRGPSRWRATVVSDFQYTNGRVRYTFELHRENDRWTILSSKGEEL
jgi:PAS domain-containing protein